MAIGRFYYASQCTGVRSACFVEALGIHEMMKPCVIQHGGKADSSYLFMYFHSAACLNVDLADQTDAGNAIIVWDSGEWHCYGNSECDWDHSWLRVSGASVGNALALHELPLNELLFFPSEPVFAKYLDLLHGELHARQQQDAYSTERLLQLLIHELARAYNRKTLVVPPNISALRDHIERHLCESLTLPELAAQAHLSVPQFSVLFKRYYGLPPIQYLAKLRMERAAQLLVYPHLTVKEVADQVGFSDQLYFCRQFKRFYGRAPSLFRKR